MAGTVFVWNIAENQQAQSLIGGIRSIKLEGHNANPFSFAGLRHPNTCREQEIGRAARNSCWAPYDCGCVSNLWANLVNMVNPTANRAQFHHKFPTFQNWRFMTGSHGRVPQPIPNCLKDLEGKNMRTPQKNLVNTGFSLAFRLSSTQKFRHLHKSSSWVGVIIKSLSF